ncbi:putative holin [Citrobacter braakii]|uniref:putative holin n=1 Tax=Citrobacter braakii TaxID=57706 RepID=UPI001299BD75|nr:hypothetical protein [Citrobacter braakii]HBC6262508.1 hypothetical protein [Citrobacter braakii]HBC8730365.1 hypothetical protein [Citrobacter braakii]
MLYPSKNVPSGTPTGTLLLNAAILALTQDPQLIISAFAGSIIFIVTASDFSVLSRVVLFTASMLTGIISAEFSATLLSSTVTRLLNVPVKTPDAVGAIFSAAAAVRLLMYLSMKPRNKHSILESCFREKEK